MKNLITKFNKIYNKTNEKKLDTNFGNILKITRQNKNYTQNDMAKILNCCGSYLSKIENGQITNPKNEVIDTFRLSFNEESKIYNLDNQQNLYQDILTQIYNHSLNIDFTNYLKNQDNIPSVYLLKFIYYVYNKNIKNSYYYLEKILDNKIIFQNQQEEIFYISLIYLLIQNLKFYDAYNIYLSIKDMKKSKNTNLILNLYSKIIEYFLFTKEINLETLLNIELELIKNKFNKTLELFNVFKFLVLKYNENIFKFYFNKQNNLIDINNIKILKLILENDVDKAHELIIELNKENSNSFLKLLEVITFIKKGYIKNIDYLIKNYKKFNEENNFILNTIFNLIKLIYETDTNLLKNQIKSYFEIDNINSIQSILILEEVLNLSFFISNNSKKYKSFLIVYELYNNIKNTINKVI